MKQLLAVFEMFETKVIILPVLKVTAAGTSKSVLTRTSPFPVRFVVAFYNKLILDNIRC